MDLSVIIVNYNVKYFLEQALISLKKACVGLETEYLIVDNASRDGSVDYIRTNFPEVEVIASPSNLGFGKANNIALKKARGKFLLVINPDTVVGEDSIHRIIDFLKDNPQTGVVCPKIIDREGKFDPACRRGLPTPFTAFSKIIGLSALFPKSRIFGKYNLTYLDPDEPAEVDVLGGAFMLLRREVYEQVGGFDEEFFMYGEDVDWSYRIQLAGWKLQYFPQAQIIHYGGESALRSDTNTRAAFYDAMNIFVKKHFKKQMPLAIPLIRLGIFMAYILDWTKRNIPKLRPHLIDISVLNLSLFTGWFIRNNIVGPLIADVVEYQILMVPQNALIPFTIYNISWLAIMMAMGVYGRKKNSYGNTVWAIVIGLLFIYSFNFIFKQFAYSRFVFIFAGMCMIFLIPGWRWLALKLPKSGGFKELFRRRTVLVGIDNLTLRIAKRAESSDFQFKIIGFIENGHENLGKNIAGYEVLGSLEETNTIIEKLSIEEVIFSGISVPYGDIVRFVDSFRGKASFKVIPESALVSADGELPFLEIGYKRKPRWLSRWVKNR